MKTALVINYSVAAVYQLSILDVVSGKHNRAADFWLLITMSAHPNKPLFCWDTSGRNWTGHQNPQTSWLYGWQLINHRSPSSAGPHLLKVHFRWLRYIQCMCVYSSRLQHYIVADNVHLKWYMIYGNEGSRDHSLGSHMSHIDLQTHIVCFIVTIPKLACHYRMRKR